MAENQNRGNPNQGGQNQGNQNPGDKQNAGTMQNKPGSQGMGQQQKKEDVQSGTDVVNQDQNKIPGRDSDRTQGGSGDGRSSGGRNE